MNLLVPYDFTPIAKVALTHALEIQKKLKGKVELLHIVSKERDREDADEQFQTVLGELSAEERLGVSTKVRVGDIFNDISKEAEEGEYQMTVMGTHGAHGLQKLFGSKAIKVITSSSQPYIITQGKGPTKKIERIVVPVELAKESIQIVKFASAIAKRFDSEVHLLCKPESDEWFKNKLRSNIINAGGLLAKAGIKYELKTLPGVKDFDQEVIAYGAANDCDLFAVAHFSETILPQFERFSQNIITNELEVPVLIVNARDMGKVNSKYSFLSV